MQPYILQNFNPKKYQASPDKLDIRVQIDWANFKVFA